MKINLLGYLILGIKYVRISLSLKWVWESWTIYKKEDSQT